MSDSYIESLQQNYLELSASTGESLESIAARVESHGDRNTAAWLRQRAAGNAPAGTDPAAAAPQGRRAAGNGSVKAAADDADEAAARAAAEAAAKAAADEAAKAAADEAAKAAADAKK